MKTIETTLRADADKVLRLTIPVDEPNRRYHMVIVLVPEEESTPAEPKDERGWPIGYFENVIGSIKDESFVRHPQGEYEKRLEFE